MNKKQKFRIVVMVPVIATVIIAGLAIYFVLQVGSSGARTGVAYTPELAEVTDPALVVANNDAGSSGDEQPALVEAECNYNKWVGKAVDETAVKAEGHPYRILGPNSAATMDYNPERINVITDDKNVVTAVRCG